MVDGLERALLENLRERVVAEQSRRTELELEWVSLQEEKKGSHILFQEEPPARPNEEPISHYRIRQREREIREELASIDKRVSALLVPYNEHSISIKQQERAARRWTPRNFWREFHQRGVAGAAEWVWRVIYATLAAGAVYLFGPESN